jgi:hypothetical protein
MLDNYVRLYSIFSFLFELNASYQNHLCFIHENVFFHKNKINVEVYSLRYKVLNVLNLGFYPMYGIFFR